MGAVQWRVVVAVFAGWGPGELIDFLLDTFLCQKAVPLTDEILMLKLSHKNE